MRYAFFQGQYVGDIYYMSLYGYGAIGSGVGFGYSGHTYFMSADCVFVESCISSNHTYCTTRRPSYKFSHRCSSLARLPAPWRGHRCLCALRRPAPQETCTTSAGHPSRSRSLSSLPATGFTVADSVSWSIKAAALTWFSRGRALSWKGRASKKKKQLVCKPIERVTNEDCVDQGVEGRLRPPCFEPFMSIAKLLNSAMVALRSSSASASSSASRRKKPSSSSE